MNKLINRISPETSENRILHAGFSIILMSEEITQTLSGLSSDMIIFILSGSITIYSTKEEKKTIGEQYMIFLRSFENYTYDITLGSNKSRKTKRDGCEKRNAFIETKTKCASNLIRKVTAYLQNQSKTPSLYIKINGIQMDF